VLKALRLRLDCSRSGLEELYKLNETLPTRPEEHQWRKDQREEGDIRECIKKIRETISPDPGCLYHEIEDWRLVDVDDLVKYDFVKVGQRANFGKNKWFVSSRGRLVYFRKNPFKEDELIPTLSKAQPRLDNKRISNLFSPPPPKRNSTNPPVAEVDRDEEEGAAQDASDGESASDKTVYLTRSVIVFFSFIDVENSRFRQFNKEDYVVDHINEDPRDNNLRNLWILTKDENKQCRKFRQRNNTSRVVNVICQGKPKKTDEDEDTYVPLDVFVYLVRLPSELVEFDRRLAEAEAEVRGLSASEKKDLIEDATYPWYEHTGTL